MTPFDFGQHVGKRPAPDRADPLALFESLDRKTSHTTLRPTQIQALRLLHERRGKQRDFVLKMPTGTGKSAVGLLFLAAKGAELQAPVVYVCPTVQLVEQVLEEGERLGIPCYHYPAGEPHPETSCLSGKAVTVCTYDKLFNGKTTFDRADVNITPGAMVLDDAHAGVEEVRDAFTIRITDEAAVAELRAVLGGAARTYARSYWEDLEQNRPEAHAVEIPYWSMHECAPAVAQVLARHTELREVMFSWPHVRQVLCWCRCGIGPDGIEIAPPVLPVRHVRAFRDSGARLFMSATLADDSVLVRELGCEPGAALAPVAPSPGTFGERQVLVPSLIDRSLALPWVREFCARISEQWNVAVICSSEKEARKWEDVGARVVLDREVSDAVRDLRDGSAKFVVFANRYDGVDLPDDACRVLVLDGMPSGQGILARIDGSARGGFQHRMAYRIEQGMGRAVRSHADYAVVILAGSGLASFTAKPEVRAQMSPDARAQIELAHELPRIVGKRDAEGGHAVFEQMVNQCLTRAAGWKQFYEERVREVVRDAKNVIDKERVALAAAERSAAESAHAGNGVQAARILQGVLDGQLAKDKVKGKRLQEQTRAFVLQSLACYISPSDPGTALGLQHQAYELDPGVLRPAASNVKRRIKSESVQQGEMLLRFYKTFENPNAFVAEFETLRANLSFESDPESVEQAIKDLAAYIGGVGWRPEADTGEGPDDMIEWMAAILIIEAKTDRGLAFIPKKDAEQLLHSVEWFANNFTTQKERGIPVMLASATKCDTGVQLAAGHAHRHT